MSIEARPRMRAVLLTSQPPLHAQRRTSPDGEDISTKYAIDCNRSWSLFFPKVVSVNSVREQGLGIEDITETVRWTESDLLRTTGKPLVLLDDLLHHSEGNDLIGLINADVFLAKAPILFDKMSRDTFLVERRTDVRRIDETIGDPYPHGFDFFVIPANLMPIIRGTNFAIGVPWWDHYVPVALILNGARPIGTGVGTAFSLVHEERWDWHLWITYGLDYIRLVRRYLSPLLLLRSGFRRFAWTIWSSAFVLKFSRRPSRTEWALQRVSRENLRLVEHWRNPRLRVRVVAYPPRN